MRNLAGLPKEYTHFSSHAGWLKRSYFVGQQMLRLLGPEFTFNHKKCLQGKDTIFGWLMDGFASLWVVWLVCEQFGWFRVLRLTKERCYSYCCYGIRTAIKSALWQRNNICIQHYLQLMLATFTMAILKKCFWLKEVSSNLKYSQSLPCLSNYFNKCCNINSQILFNERTVCFFSNI